ncbi:MAG: type II toxin-antitoxin system death-on-curing family toxin [Clostridia bacterium]|nr:type II toxin-antitoxin system death-on-curing family toxin [Clostridia bacterium]
MIKLSQENVMLLHQFLIKETGGNPNLRDEGLLNSALESVYQTFGGEELYPTVEEKGARLGFTLISNHAFIDGNKRIGMLVMLTFLELNGARITPSVSDVFRMGIGVASGELGYEELLEWIRSNRG